MSLPYKHRAGYIVTESRSQNIYISHLCLGQWFIGRKLPGFAPSRDKILKSLKLNL